MQVTDKLIHIKLFHKQGRHYLKLDDTQAKAVSDFNQKILSKRIPFEGVLCLCGNDEFSLVASIDRYGLMQSTVICKECGLIQSNPRMTEAYYKFFYESDEYRRLYDKDDFIEKYEAFYTDGRGDSIYQTIIKHKSLKEIKSVLEFGAGGGWNLLPFVKQGVGVRGYDFSKELVKLGKSKGISLIQGSINDVEGKHDVIILNHVIEHFTNFMDYIKRLKTHLNDRGIIYVAVPDIEQFHIGHLQNAHVYYFSLKTLRYYMGKCGLKMVHYQAEAGTHMSAIFTAELPRIDDSSLDNHYQEMVKILKNKIRVYNPFRRLIIKILELARLKKVIKRMLNRL